MDKTFTMKKRWTWLIMPVFILICISCSKKQPYSILEFTGEGAVVNDSKGPFEIYNADSVHSVSLLAEPGDIINLEGLPFYYRDISTTKYSFEQNGDNLYINGKIYNIDIPEEDSLVEWFDTLMASDISGLELIRFPFPIPENYVPFINEISKLKPNIGIVIGENWWDGWDSCCVNEELLEIIENFNPRFLRYGYLTTDNLEELSRFKDLEVLELGLVDTILSGSLPPLPHLKRLKDLSLYVFSEDLDEDSVIIPVDYLKNILRNNTQIENLATCQFANGDRIDSLDISFISPLKRLKKLRIGVNLVSLLIDIPTLKNIQILREMKHLEFVNVDYCSAGMDTIFDDLTNIRWLSLYYDTTPGDLSTIVKFHPNLEVLTIYNDTIQNLQPLLGLSGLYGLIIMDTLTDRSTLLSMKNLKYLSLPSYLESDSLYYASLQDSLPGCKIAFNEKLGGCLGSGWLFLLIPFIMLFSFLGRLKFSSIRKYFIF